MLKKLLCSLLLFVLIGCSSAAPEPTPLPPLEVIEESRYTVEPGRVEETLQFAGRTTPLTEESLFFPVDGTVTEVLFGSGAAVETGTALARLAVFDLEQQLAEAELALRSAETRRDAAEQTVADNLTDARRSLAEAQLRLQQAELTTNTGELAAAEVALENATDASQRRVAEAQLTDAQNRAEAHALTVQLLAADVAAIETQIERLERGVDAQVTIEIEQAQLAVTQLQAAIAERTMTAPLAGTITVLDIRPGDEVEGFDQLGIVADTGAIGISAEPAFEDLNRMSIGQAVSIEFSGRDELFSGEITTIPAFGSADSRVRVTIDNPPANLQPGELATMTIVLQVAEDALILPTAAIRDFQGRTFVIIEDADGTRRRVDVQPGISDGINVAIASGVEAGQVVVGE